MTVVTATIEIAAAPAVVFDAVMDPESCLKWVTIVKSVGPYDEGPVVKGFRMDQRLVIRGAPFTVAWKLAKVDAPWFARWEGKGPARSRAVIENRLVETENGTRFEYLNEFKAPLGPLGAVASKALVGGVPESEANASLVQLKAMLESP